VGDGVTLVFAPLAAALGLAVAKLSGRGLGHTGGTLDKLESIRGSERTWSPIASRGRCGRSVARSRPNHHASCRPTEPLCAPRRDGNGSVRAVDRASVMSKKLAVDSDLILLDVKAGSGAFMKEGCACARSRRSVSCPGPWRGAPLRRAITDMSSRSGGDRERLDIIEAVEVLSGARHGRLRDLSIWFAARALRGRRGSLRRGQRSRRGALEDGTASERFARMIEAQGGDLA